MNQPTTEENKSSIQKLTQKNIDYLVNMLADDNEYFEENYGYNDDNNDVQITKHLTEKDIDYLVNMLDGQQMPNNKKTRKPLNNQINSQLNININYVPQYKIRKIFIPYENLSWFDKIKYNLGFFG